MHQEPGRRIGTTLRGKYRIDALIGMGGVAVVYKATHRNRAEFAVKMLRPELANLEDVRKRFLREGYAANSVKHPGVVLVVDDDIAEDGAAFLVMELLDGMPCDALWEERDNQLSVEAACSIGHDVLDVLVAAHANGIIHRDLKPANLFLSREGNVKVLDFGIARVRDFAASITSASGVTIGTPAYMPPEQARGKSDDIDAQTDLWAVGATLFTLLSGEKVHQADNAVEMIVKAASEKPRSLATVAPNVPLEIVRVVDRALAFHKTDRWPTASAMRDALVAACKTALGAPPSMAWVADAMAGRRTVTHRPKPLALAPPASSRLRLAATIAAGLLVVVSAALLGLHAAGVHGQPPIAREPEREPDLVREPPSVLPLDGSADSVPDGAHGDG
jgi:eukaryotic-like serine/threonine-protein kinase